MARVAQGQPGAAEASAGHEQGRAGTQGCPSPCSASSAGAQLSNGSQKTQTRFSSSLRRGRILQTRKPWRAPDPTGCGSGQTFPPIISSGVTGVCQDMDLSHISHIQRGAMTAFQGYIALLIHFMFLRKKNGFNDQQTTLISSIVIDHLQYPGTLKAARKRTFRN